MKKTLLVLVNIALFITACTTQAVTPANTSIPPDRNSNSNKHAYSHTNLHTIYANPNRNTNPTSDEHYCNAGGRLSWQ